MPQSTSLLRVLLVCWITLWQYIQLTASRMLHDPYCVSCPGTGDLLFGLRLSPPAPLTDGICMWEVSYHK
eukprot:jgi/Chrzof1/628/Cz01g23010.t1